MHRAADILAVVRTIILRNDDGRAGAESHEEIQQQIDDRDRRTADRGQRRLADELSDDDRVDHRIELLQERTRQDRQRKAQHVLQHRPMQQISLAVKRLCHGDPPLEIASSLHHIPFFAFCKRFYKNVTRSNERVTDVTGMLSVWT